MRFNFLKIFCLIYLFSNIGCKKQSGFLLSPILESKSNFLPIKLGTKWEYKVYLKLDTVWQYQGIETQTISQTLFNETFGTLYLVSVISPDTLVKKYDYYFNGTKFLVGRNNLGTIEAFDSMAIFNKKSAISNYYQTRYFKKDLEQNYDDTFKLRGVYNKYTGTVPIRNNGYRDIMEITYFYRNIGPAYYKTVYTDHYDSSGILVTKSIQYKKLLSSFKY